MCLMFEVLIMNPAASTCADPTVIDLQLAPQLERQPTARWRNRLKVREMLVLAEFAYS